jgi:hypothetical protein
MAEEPSPGSNYQCPSNSAGSERAGVRAVQFGIYAHPRWPVGRVEPWALTWTVGRWYSDVHVVEWPCERRQKAVLSK